VKNSSFPALHFVSDYFEKADFRLNLVLKPVSSLTIKCENEPQALKRNYSRLMRALKSLTNALSKKIVNAMAFRNRR
jgi:hypothetical protein